MDVIVELLGWLLDGLLPPRHQRAFTFVLIVTVALGCFAISALFLYQAVFGDAEPILALPALLFAGFGVVCLVIAKRGRSR
ncbi:MAG: hypothetical protein WCB63_05465 [Polyangiales bacterium]